MNGADVVIEAWMARKLGLPRSWDGGVTTRADRREKIRAVILEGAKAHTIAGRRPNKTPETWSELFRRVYREPLNVSEAA